MQLETSPLTPDRADHQHIHHATYFNDFTCYSPSRSARKCRHFFKGRQR